jgi:hypothetical protein
MAEMSKAMFELYEPDVKEIKAYLKRIQKDTNKPRYWFRKYARSSIPNPIRLRQNVEHVMQRFKGAIDVTTGEQLINLNTSEVVERVLNLAAAGRISGK